MKGNEGYLGCVFSVLLCTFTSRVTFANTQSLGGKGEYYFPQLFTPFFSLRPVTTPIEDFSFPLDIKESMFLLLGLPGLLSAVHTMFRVTEEIFREAFQRSALRTSSPEWHEM